MPYVVAAPQFGRPSSGPRSSGQCARNGAGCEGMYSDDSSAPYQDSLNSLRARENRQREEGLKKYAAEYYECQNKVIRGELPVNTPCQGKTTRQILNDRITNNKSKLSYFNSSAFAGERNIKQLVSTKRRLLLKGAKPKSKLSPLGRTLRYKSNAPFVNWNKWGETIRDPRLPLFGEKKEFPLPTEANINYLETYNGMDEYGVSKKFYKIPNGGRKTRKNRR